MNCYNKYLIVCADISSRPKLLAPLRGKVSKEIYRCGKGIICSGSFKKPIIYALSTIPKEASSGIIYSAIGNVGETVIGYIGGIAFVRWVYKMTDITLIKETARIIYNFGSLPILVYYKGVSGVFDALQISKIEKWWFGEPVYVFNDNRIWIESNFTLQDVIKKFYPEKSE